MTPSPRKAHGFSLVELLVVMAIVAILAGLSFMLIPSLSRSGQFDQELVALSGTLEQARQYAVAQNTYVWVAFLSPDPVVADQLDVAVVASADGTEVGIPGSGSPPGPATWGTPASGSSLISVAKVQMLPFINLGPAGTVTPATPPASKGTDLASDASFAIVIPSHPSTSTFTKAIEFTPTGEARVLTGTPVSLIEFDVQPYRGPSVIDPHNGAVIQIGGLTGAVHVYRQ